MSDPKNKDDNDDGGRFPTEPETKSRPADVERSDKESEKPARRSDDD